MATSRDRSSSTTSKKRRKPVQVVECPPAFPGGDDWDARGGDDATGDGARGPNRRRRRGEATEDTAAGEGGSATRGTKRGRDDADAPAPPVLDFHGAAREVRELGTTTFTGAQLRKHREDTYRKITGREMKKQKIPVKILWGMQRKKERKERAAAEEARASGIVTGTASGGPRWKRKEEEKRREQKRAFEKRKNVSLYGPAPSIGFMKAGMLRVTKNK